MSSDICVIRDTGVSLDLALTNHSNRISLVSSSPVTQFYQHDAARAKPLVSQFKLFSTTFVNFSLLGTELLIIAVILKMWFRFNLCPRLGAIDPIIVHLLIVPFPVLYLRFFFCCYYKRSRSGELL